MPTVVSRKKPASDWVEDFRQHITMKLTGKKATEVADKYKKNLKALFDTRKPDYVDEQGSKYIWLPQTVKAGGKSFKGVKLLRSVTPYFDEKKAESVLKRKNLLESALTQPPPFIDQDKIRILQQEGEISEKELDSMFGEDESWAFWSVEGEVE